MPVGRALDPEPVDVAVLVDIGQPRYFRIFRVTVIDQRMNLWRTEAASECRQLGGTEILFAEHQHRMLGEGSLDPGEGSVVEWLGQIDAERLGAERVTKRA